MKHHTALLAVILAAGCTSIQAISPQDIVTKNADKWVNYSMYEVVTTPEYDDQEHMGE
jgi:hypothetical protein